MDYPKSPRLTITPSMDEQQAKLNRVEILL